MKWLEPKAALTESDVKKGLRMVIGDGLATEAMTVLTGGTFLIALAVLLGASNFQIGVLVALPTLTNIFQLLSIWLVGKYRNRRKISVVFSILARVTLIAIGMLAVFSIYSANLLITFLFFFCFFGSIAGPSWNSWMKDLVPENILGSYFAKRTRTAQILNVILSLVLAVILDYVKSISPRHELTTYAIMFIIGGVVGILGALILSRAPEPVSSLTNLNLFKLLKQPIQNKNFARLLIFNSAWVFALNIAIPFFTVYMIRTLNLSLIYIVGLTTIGVLSSILTVQIWGALADKYSNKTIIAIGGPIYALCLIAWCFVEISTRMYMNIFILIFIYIASGISTSGINLSLTNIGLKLAPKEDAIVYLTARNIVTAIFSSIAPVLGGWLADFFTTRHFSITAQWISPNANRLFRLLVLHEWNFLFLIGALLALVALQYLPAVKEVGEVDKDKVIRIVRTNVKTNFKDYFLIGGIIELQEQIKALIRKRLRL
ncbi:MAG: MFS transporter [Bacteroidetes bacterium]|nr:MAG: MFS transporter [Bacteroidota bacterium]